MALKTIPMAEPKGFQRSPLLEDQRTRFFIITSNQGENVVKSVTHNVWATQRKNEQRLNEAFQSSPAVVLIFSVIKSGAFQGYALMRSATGRATSCTDPFNGFGRLFDLEWMRLQDLEATQTYHLRNRLDESRQVAFSRDGQELEHSVGSELCRLIDIKVYQEDPDAYEPITAAREQLRAPGASAPALPASSAALGLPPQAPPQAAYGSAQPPPPGAYGTAPVQHAHYHTHYLPPPGAYPHHPSGAYPGHPSPYGHPPWAVAPDLYAHRRSRRHGKKRKRKHCSSSYSSESESGEQKKKKKKAKKKSKKEKGPDFENCSYEEYVQWLNQKQKQTPLPGAPSQGAPAGAQQPAQPPAGSPPEAAVPEASPFGAAALAQGSAAPTSALTTAPAATVNTKRRKARKRSDEVELQLREIMGEPELAKALSAPGGSAAALNGLAVPTQVSPVALSVAPPTSGGSSTPAATLAASTMAAPVDVGPPAADAAVPGSPEDWRSDEDEGQGKGGQGEAVEDKAGLVEEAENEQDAGKASDDESTPSAASDLPEEDVDDETVAEALLAAQQSEALLAEAQALLDQAESLDLDSADAKDSNTSAKACLVANAGTVASGDSDDDEEDTMEARIWANALQDR